MESRENLLVKKRYTVVYQKGNSCGHCVVDADSFHVTDNVMYFNDNNELIFMIGVNNLLYINIDTCQEDTETVESLTIGDIFSLETESEDSKSKSTNSLKKYF